MSERFFYVEPITSHRVTLGGTEAHHLLHVMRAAVGQHITLFDDSGAEFLAAVETLGRTSVSVRIIECHRINRELPFALTFGVALPKGERQKWLIEKLTELGATVLVPLVTERSVAQPAAAALERLRRSVIEASKQCGRNRLLKIQDPVRWDEWLQQPNEPEECRRFVAHPGGRPLPECTVTHRLPTYVTVGPEGGLTDAEIAAAVGAGWQAVDLGPRILRVETATVALAAAIVLGNDSRSSGPA